MYAMSFANTFPGAMNAEAFSACASGFASSRSARFVVMIADTVNAVSAFILSVIRLSVVIIINIIKTLSFSSRQKELRIFK